MFDRYELGTLTWGTKDGQIILVSEMGDRHLINARNHVVKRMNECIETTLSTWSDFTKLKSMSMILSLEISKRRGKKIDMILN